MLYGGMKTKQEVKFFNVLTFYKIHIVPRIDMHNNSVHASCVICICLNAYSAVISCYRESNRVSIYTAFITIIWHKQNNNTAC